MLPLWFLLITVAGIQAACLNGYTEDNGNCFSPTLSPTSHNAAYARCAQDNAFIRDVPNGFMNSQVQSQGRGYEDVWLGLTCTGSTFQSCTWDSGRNVTSTSYANFASNNPSTSVGACVVMRVATGKWYSMDCSQSTASYICETTPGVTVPRCTSGSYYFNGYCYFAASSTSSSSAENYCSGRCGHLASIHSDGENSFVRDLASSTSSAHYSFIGLQRSGSSYSWTDGTAVDYKNFGYENSALGSCTTMAIVDGEVVNKSQWISSQCTSSSSLAVVCKKNVQNSCDPTPTPPTTMAPPVCSGTQFVSGYGQLYSPGYPYGSDPNSCDYLVSEDEGSQASITIQQASLDQYSSISLYKSFFDPTPFARLTNGKYSSQTYYSNSNILKVVYNTSGSETFNNLWYADYGYAAGSTPYVETTTTVVETTTYSGCGYYRGSGTVQIPPVWECTYTFHNAAGVQDAICIRFLNYANGYVYIYEGDTNDYNSIIAYFAPVDPANTYCTSNSSVMTIMTEFQDIVEIAYDAAWNMVPTISLVTPTPPSTSCFYDLYGSGEFISPNYPQNYPANAFCVYRFHSSRSRIVLRFNDYSTGYVVINIYEGYPEENTFIFYENPDYWYNLYSKQGRNFTSQSEMVTLTFQAGNSTAYRGFSGVFSSSW